MPEDQSQERKKNLIRDFNDTRLSILRATRGLPGEKVSEVFLGSWGILDLLAHLHGWDLTNMASAASILSGELPDFYVEYDKDWASYNAKLIAEHKRGDLELMVALVEESRSSLVDFLEQLSPEEIFGDYGVRRGRYKITINKLIEAETKDERTHLDQIRQFLK